MKAATDAKVRKPPSELRNWVAVLAAVGVITGFGVANAVSEGISPSQFAPRLAGAVLAGLIGWAGLRAVRRRNDDLHFVILFFLPVLNATHFRDGFARAFFFSLGLSLAMSLFLLVVSPAISRPIQPPSPDPPWRDADLDGATGSGGVDGGRAGS